jgi:hypothetical protein
MWAWVQMCACFLIQIRIIINYMNFKIMIWDVTPYYLIEWYMRNFSFSQQLLRKLLSAGMWYHTTFWKNVLPPFSGWKNLTLRLEDGGHIFLQNVGNDLPDYMAYLLTHGAQPFLRSCQLCSHSKSSQRFMEPEGSLPPSQVPSTGPYPEPDRSNPHHPILSL